MSPFFCIKLGFFVDKPDTALRTAGCLHSRLTKFFKVPKRLSKGDLYARHTRIWNSQGIDWVSTASGSERRLAPTPLATARGTASSPQSRSWCAQHIDS